MRKPIRAVAIVIYEDKILLMWRKNNGHEYYVLPGGGVESSESVAEAVIREVREETCLEVKLEKMLYHHHYFGDSDQFFYLCSYISGDPMLGEGNEKDEMAESDNIYDPQWVPIDQIKNLLVYPLEIRDWILEDLKNNFQNTPKKISMKVSDIRNSL